MAALTVPYAERIDQRQRKMIPDVQKILGAAACTLTERVGGVAAALRAAAGRAHASER
jgi:hypothetical protein